MTRDDAPLQPAHADDPLVGTILQDRYRVIRKLGEGGFGAVYEGEHVLIKRRVAIKCLHPELAQHAEVVTRFHREALAATAIGHEHIIEVTDMGRSAQGPVFMVLEYLEGRDWAKELEEEGPQPLEKVVHIVSQIADALNAAHDKGIVHRDLKPENVFLITRRGDDHFVKVLDFGISKIKDVSETTRGGMTKTGSTLGTPYYLPPEQAQGKKDLDHRADIYSLGVIIFEALTGRYPFEGASYPELVLKICTEPTPSIRQYRPDLPEEVERILARMLEKNPDDRFRECGTVKDALAAYREDFDRPLVAEEPPSAATLQASSAAMSPEEVPSDANGKAQERSPERSPSAPGPVVTRSDYRLPTRSRLPLVVGAAALLGLLAGGVGLAVTMDGFRTSPGDTGEHGNDRSGKKGATAASAAGSHDAAGRGGNAASLNEKARDEELPNGVAATGKGRVHVEITTLPKDADLYLDGRPISNPFDGELPKTRAPWRIEAEKEGYENDVRDLVLHSSRSIRIALEPQRRTMDRHGSGLKRRARPTRAAHTSTRDRTASSRGQTRPNDTTPEGAEDTGAGGSTGAEGDSAGNADRGSKPGPEPQARDHASADGGDGSNGLKDLEL